MIVRNTFEIILPFQDTEYLSVLALNRAFDNLSNIIEGDVRMLTVHLHVDDVDVLN